MRTSFVVLLSFWVLRFWLNAADRRRSLIKPLGYKSGLERAFRLIFFIFYFFGSSIRSGLWLVQIFLDVNSLLFVVLETRAELPLNQFSILFAILLLDWVRRYVELLNIWVLIFAEPVIEHPHRNILMICSRLERTFLHLTILALPS